MLQVFLVIKLSNKSGDVRYHFKPHYRVANSLKQKYGNIKGRGHVLDT